MTGDVAGVSVMRSVHPDLARAVAATIQRWKFRPHLVGGKAATFCYRPEFQIQPPARSDLHLPSGLPQG